MPDSLVDLKRKTLEERLADLHQEYKAANAQLSRTLSDVERIRIQRQIKDLEQQIQQTESELGQIAQRPHDTLASSLTESDESVKQKHPNRRLIDLPPDMPLHEKVGNLIMYSLGQVENASMAAAMHILALLALSSLFAWWLVQVASQAIETWQVAAGVWLGLTFLPLVVGAMPQQREKVILSGLAGKQRLALRLEKAFGAYISAFLGEMAAIVILLVLNYLGLWSKMSLTSKGIFWFVAEWFTFILSFVGAVIATKYWENLLQKGDPVGLKADHFLLSLGFPLVVCPTVMVFGFATLSLWKEPLFGVPIIAFGLLFLAWQLNREEIQKPKAQANALAAPEKLYGVGNRWAVLAGVNAYTDKANYGQLHVCVKDVQAIHTQLIAGGFDPERIRLLTDDTPEPPTRDNILVALKAVADATEPDDLLLFYYSGHGDEDGGESYLVARNGRRLVLDDTAVKVSRVKEIMEQAPARAQVIVLDACHSGADIGGKGARPMSAEFMRRVFEQSEGLAVLASCQQGQLSYEWRARERSVFTHFLLQALAGQADRDDKGFVTVQDANRHVVNGVKLWASQHDASQTPTLQYAVSGDIVLARYR